MAPDQDPEGFFTFRRYSIGHRKSGGQMQCWTHVLWLTASLALGCTSSGIKSTTTGTGNNGGGNNSGGNGGAGGGVGDPGNGPTCGVRTFGLQKVPPDLLIVLDKSGSMDESADATCRRNCGAMAKWPTMTAAINQVVMQTEATIRWGLNFFPGDRQCGVNAMPAVPSAHMNAMAINTAIAGTNPNGATPTAAAVAGASMYLTTLADPNPKFILLATDRVTNRIGD